jgi:uncharacterized membrane protein
VLQDEQYHLMQLYIHEDVPYSCRLKLPDETYVKMPIEIHGSLEKSHMDVDTKVNLLLMMTSDKQSVDSAVGVSLKSGTTEGHIIGNEITWQFQVNWYDESSLPIMSNLLHLKYRAIGYCVATFVATVVLCVGAFHLVIIPRRLKSLAGFTKLD